MSPTPDSIHHTSVIQFEAARHRYPTCMIDDHTCWIINHTDRDFVTTGGGDNHTNRDTGTTCVIDDHTCMNAMAATPSTEASGALRFVISARRTGAFGCR